MSRYLMTQSLLSSWLYQYNAYDQEEAHKDFLTVLKRIPTKTTEAMSNGLEFEKLVADYCAKKEVQHKWINGIKSIGDIVKGGCFQVAAYTKKQIYGIDFLLYGRIDVLKQGVIYDIKFSKSYECGKYLGSPQHPMYFECCPEAREFQYLIYNGNEVYTEKYIRSETNYINELIEEFMKYLQNAQLSEVYFEKWKAKQ